MLVVAVGIVIILRHQPILYAEAKLMQCHYDKLVSMPGVVDGRPRH